MFKFLDPLFDRSRMNFIVLLPLAATVLMDDEKAMNAAEINAAFVGNTVVAQLPEGEAYAYVKPNGATSGMHPTYGKLTGKWAINDQGVVCVTWPVASGEIKNCSATVDLGNGKYDWANQVIRLSQGDPKGLGG